MKFEETKIGAKIREKITGTRYLLDNEIDDTWVPIHPRKTSVTLNPSHTVSVQRQQFPVVPACAITIHKSQGDKY